MLLKITSGTKASNHIKPVGQLPCLPICAVVPQEMELSSPGDQDKLNPYAELTACSLVACRAADTALAADSCCWVVG